MRYFIFAVVFLLVTDRIHAVNISLWHSARGESKKALEEIADSFNLSHDHIQVKLLNVPFDAINDKLTTTIPLGTGPDVFIFPHDFVGAWAEQGLILPLESYLTPGFTDQFFSKTLQAFNYMYPEAVWAIPHVFNNLVMFYNRDKIKNPPQKMSEIIQVARGFTEPKKGQLGKFGFVYQVSNFYFHTMWIQGFGGKIFRSLGFVKGFPLLLPLFYTEPMVKAAQYVRKNIIQTGICHPEPSDVMVRELFNTGNALFAINGQWFRGEINQGLNYGVTRLPVIDEVNMRAIPFLTVEGFFLSSTSKHQPESVVVIEYFTSAAMAKTMAKTGKLTPANKKAYEYAVVRDDPISGIFKEAAQVAISMPNTPEMAVTWMPATFGLGDMVNGADIDSSLQQRQKEIMMLIEKARNTPGIYKQNGFDPENINEYLSVK